MRVSRSHPDTPPRAPIRGRRTALAALGTAALATVALPAAALPEQFVAHYSLYTQGAKIGETHWTLEPLGEGRFVYESRTEPTGLFALMRDDTIVERSEWRMHRERLRPLEYRYTRTGRKARVVEVRFEWGDASGVAVNTARGTTWRMDVPTGTLDKLSYVIALMADLAAGRRHVDYSIADGGRLKTYTLEVIGAERLETTLGPLDTRMVRRIREGDEDVRETILWCAEALDFLPVKIEHRDRDGVIFVELGAVEGIAAPEP